MKYIFYIPVLLLTAVNVAAQGDMRTVKMDLLSRLLTNNGIIVGYERRPVEMEHDGKKKEGTLEKAAQKVQEEEKVFLSRKFPDDEALINFAKGLCEANEYTLAYQAKIAHLRPVSVKPSLLETTLVPGFTVSNRSVNEITRNLATKSGVQLFGGLSGINGYKRISFTALPGMSVRNVLDEISKAAHFSSWTATMPLENNELRKPLVLLQFSQMSADTAK